MADPNEQQPEGLDVQTHISDMLADYVPPADEGTPKPEADPKPVEGQPAVEPEPGEAKPEGEGEPEPEVKPAVEPPQPDPAVKTYEYRGKQYTVEQLVEQGLLEDVIQTARQFPTIQTKYQQLLEQARASQPAQAQPQGQPAPQGPSPDQIVAAYTPVVEKLAEAGFIEKEAFEAFPRMVSNAIYLRDMVFHQRQILDAVVQHLSQQEGATQKTTFLNFLDSTCDKVGGQGDHYALIKDPGVRKGFYEYLATLNIPASDVTEDFVKRQWVAYNSEAVLEAARGAAATRKVEDSKTRRNAAGEGGGPRPAPAAKVAKTVDTELIDSFLGDDKRFATGG